MTEADIYERLTGVYRDVFADNAIVLDRTTTAENIPGWDSLKMVSIIIAVETRFSVRIRSREVDGLDSVGDLADLIKAKLG